MWIWAGFSGAVARISTGFCAEAAPGSATPHGVIIANGNRARKRIAEIADTGWNALDARSASSVIGYCFSYKDGQE
jgi:hypothetical protein